MAYDYGQFVRTLVFVRETNLSNMAEQDLKTKTSKQAAKAN